MWNSQERILPIEPKKMQFRSFNNSREEMSFKKHIKKEYKNKILNDIKQKLNMLQNSMGK